MTANPGLKECKRILILGCSGTGKSTFAKMLGEKLNLEVIHLDKYFHKPNWVARDIEEFTEIVRELASKQRWIMDGNYWMTLSVRLPRADFVFLFDFPPYFCVYRILKRNFKTKLGFEKRIDLPDGCDERWLNWSFVKFTWNFRKDITQKTYNAIDESKFDKSRLLIFKNAGEFKKYLKNLNSIL